MAKIVRDKPLTPVNNPIVIATPIPAAPEFPTGNLKTKRPNVNAAYNIPISQVTRWWDVFTAAAKEFGIDPYDIAAMSVIESNSNQYTTGAVTGTKQQVIARDDGSGVLSYGMMQVKPQYHQWRVPDADAYTPSGNVRMAAAILSQGAQQYGSVDGALLNIYFPKDDRNGTTQSAYLAAKKSLVSELKGTAVSPPPSESDAYRIIFGGDYPAVEYGFLDDVGINSYAFVVAHGGTASTQHSGDDVPVPYGTKLFSPANGVVDCVGSAGTPRWGQDCGAYDDTGDAGPGGAVLGIGNITVFLDSGHKLTLGHCRTATVKVGQKVKAGQQLGTSGGQSGAHTHVEVSIVKNGTYWLLDPKPALKAAISGGSVDTRPMVLFAGAKQAVPLDVPFRIVLIPASQTRQRPGFAMTPEVYVQHETGNINPGADAEMHLRYLQNGAEGQQLGYHFTVDQDEIIQMIPGNEGTWHGGDGGTGRCNRKGIACELCVQDNNKYKDKARINAEKLAAAVMMAFPTITELQQHSKCCKDAGLGAGSGCHVNCPEYIRKDNYWPTFEAHVESGMVGGSTNPIPTYTNAIPPPEFTGDDVIVNAVTFFAIQRNFTANRDSVPALQYADLKSSPVRAPLNKGESFAAWYAVKGADGKKWLVSKFGSRIPAEMCDPAFTMAGL